MISIDPQNISTAEFHSYFLSAIAPRPIALVSTLNKQGQVNLSPFSFFNAFGANPPLLIFSPARRVRDNTTKHTLENIKEVKEAVIGVVNYDMVEQVSLASTEYDQGVNEFIKSGLTPLPSKRVQAPGIAESPVNFECKVLDIVETGTEGGAGNLIICQVLYMHCKENILNDQGKIDTRKIDLVGRMGENWYCRASGSALFEIPKPILKKGIGVDALPEHIRTSPVLTGNNLGRLGNIEKLPSQEEIIKHIDHQDIIKIKEMKSSSEKLAQLHQLAQQYLQQDQTEKAMNILLTWEYIK